MISTLRGAARFALFTTIMLVLLAPALSAQDTEDLLALDLENLMNMKVTSVSRRLEELRSSAAAVYVITQEDIRRSGVSDVAELLRTVPGMNVAQSNSSTWAVSARGFNAQYATMLLVIVDGRTVYSPTFSGVYWHLQNLILEDIDRIEVIRGPGATMWGANAVNGVISITTKQAAETQGGLFVAEAGSASLADGSFRYGGTIGKRAYYRLFTTQTTRSSFDTVDGQEGGDAWNMTHTGFRVDWMLTEADSLTFEGAAYRGVLGSRQSTLTSLTPITYETAGLFSKTGGHARARWSHSLGEDSNITLGFYADRNVIDGYGAQSVDTFDFDLQHNFKVGGRHNVMWGMGRRENRDAAPSTPSFGLTPDKGSSHLTSAFIQDEIEVLSRKLYLTVGTKVERNSFAGSNVQPSVKVSWLPTARHSFWASTSRAVRTPNRVERGMHVNFGAFDTGSGVGLVTLYGREDTRSEGLMAYETGYRYQANRRLWLDVATFYNAYDHLSTEEEGDPFFEANDGPPHLVFPIYFGNAMKGKTYGTEFAGSYKINEVWTMKGSYTLLRMNFEGYQPGTATASEAKAGRSPQNTAYAGSYINLPRSFEVSGHAYFVGGLPGFQIPSYTRLDANVAWRGLENVEISISGRNLLGSHQEFGDVPAPANGVHPEVQGRIKWTF